MNTLVKRSLSGIVYVALLVSCILWNPYSFLGIMVLFCAIMMHEFMHMTMGSEYHWSQVLSIFTGCIFFALVWAVRYFDAIESKYCFLALIPLMFVMINSLYVRDKTDFGKFANVYTALLYIALPLSINNFLVIAPKGCFSGMLLLCFFVIIWASDIGAYLFGITLGQKYGKKLFPSISPKKSWIGFWGGLVIAVTASIVMYLTGMWHISPILDQRFTIWHAIALAVIMDVMGVYGDLFESQWKRHFDVKDSGKLIPGHGGLLDRLDSSIFAVPVGVLYLGLFNFI